MSFDIGLVCYNDGKLGTLSKAILRQALMPYAHQDDDGFWRLSFPDGGGGDLDMDNLTNERQFIEHSLALGGRKSISGPMMASLEYPPHGQPAREILP